MMKPRQSEVPPTGYHYLQSSHLGEARIEGSSYEDVAGQVLKYRVANSLPLGDPLTEVYDYVCGKWPHYCSETVPAPVTPKPGAPRSPQMSTRVLEWLSRQADSRVRENPFVPENETQRRMEICMACPNNVQWTNSGCGPCISRATQLGHLLRGGAGPAHVSLGACSVIGQDNATAARLNNLLPLDPTLTLPDRCWRK